MSMYVGNLSSGVAPDDLKRVFVESGTVNCIQIPTGQV